eukprot:CAMPEP_0169067002 /NCGR_PEP_ID=MMETSP1015-20121227/3259_1 /TAXON_ID=342587 /ORGANISM="Karlodinium micrum, Strain CCMP2283" /LENGTH=258 /DNA_ID=CAMNT_0009125723 /DNA_START=42 /DNA_END=814 /DNA_ORIENTATION=+
MSFGPEKPKEVKAQPEYRITETLIPETLKRDAPPNVNPKITLPGTNAFSGCSLPGQTLGGMSMPGTNAFSGQSFGGMSMPGTNAFPGQNFGGMSMPGTNALPGQSFRGVSMSGTSAVQGSSFLGQNFGQNFGGVSMPGTSAVQGSSFPGQNFGSMSISTGALARGDGDSFADFFQGQQSFANAVPEFVQRQQPVRQELFGYPPAMGQTSIAYPAQQAQVNNISAIAPFTDSHIPGFNEGQGNEITRGPPGPPCFCGQP